MIPAGSNPVTRLNDGRYIQVIEETDDTYLVRAWDFDEQYNMIPTAKIYSMRKEEFVNATSPL